MIPSAPRQLWEHLTVGRSADERLALGFLDTEGACRGWSVAELVPTVERMGLRLRETAGRKGAVVAVLAGDQQTQALHFLAALAGGLIPAILTPPTRKQDPAWFAANLTATLASVAPDLVLTDRPELLGGHPGRVARTWSLQLLQDANQPTPLHPPADTAFLQFSSGTTGHKKGVAISVTAAARQLYAYAAALGVTSGDSVVSWLPLYHDMGLVTALLLPLAAGISARMLEPLDFAAAPIRYLRAVTRYRATLGWHPNFAYQFLAERVRPAAVADLDLCSLRLLVNCAEPVTHRAQAAFLSRFASAGLAEDVLTGCYAMAETTFALTHQPDSQRSGLLATADGSDPLISVGEPLPGVHLEARTPDGVVCSDGDVGELWVQAPFLASGYAGNPDATRATFVGGWYRTGDLGMRHNGGFYVRGRSKDLIIAAGHNVVPDDIEALVGAMPGVRGGRVAAFGTFDERLQTERVTVLAEPDRAQPVDRAAVLSTLSAALNLTGVHFALVEPTWLVKSSSGKISRSQSAAKWRRQQSAIRAQASGTDLRAPKVDA